MIKNVIFDVGMVLVDFKWREYLKTFNFTEEIYNKVANAMFLSKEWNEYDRSILSDEETVKSFIKNAPDVEKEIREVFKNVGNAIITFEYSSAWINELKNKDYKVYILSNYARRTYELTKKQLSFVKLCDGAVFSFEINKIKPETEIFYELIRRYNIKPEDSVFLDDNINNVKAAVKLGFNVINFIGKEQAVNELKRLGIK